MDYLNTIFRQLVLAKERVDTGLKKLLETNQLVANMEVRKFIIKIKKLYYFFYFRLN